MRPAITKTDIRTIESGVGPGAINRAVTATLFVSPNGDNTDGTSWNRAFTTIQGALNSASTDANECTLILVGINTGPNNYDIDTTGDPTWTGNYIIKGTHRTWAKIKNTHATGSSIMKFTGYASLEDLNFNLGTGSTNGVVITKGAFRVRNCQFVGEDLTGSANGLWVNASSPVKNGIVQDCHFQGESGSIFMTSVRLNDCANSLFERLQIHDCGKGIHITGSGSDRNLFHFLDIGDSDIGVDIDAGNEQHIEHCTFHHCVTNIDDEVGDHIMSNLIGPQSITIEPDTFTGSNVATGNGINTWTVANVTLRGAATSTKPFRIISVHSECDATEKFRVRLSNDLGSTYFDDLLIEGTANANKRTSLAFPGGTETIFNAGTKIEASSKSESDGVDNAIIWLSIQEI